MKYNTGKASPQISAAEKDHYWRKVKGKQPTYRQKQYYKFLMATSREHNVDVSDAVGGKKLDTITDYSVAIERVVKALREAGVSIRESEYERKQKARKKEFAKRKSLQALQTKWTYMTEGKPTYHIVNTLDEDGFTRILEWNGKYFHDAQGNPIINGKHRFKEPIAWARLG